MSLLVAWAAYPLLLCALSLGCGLLLDRLGGGRLRGSLLLPAGFALLVVASTLTTTNAVTARATSPLVVVLALAGFVLGRRARYPIDRFATLAGLGIFAVYAAPIVLSGSATFAGYMTLDDTATWLALADNALEHGRSLGSLPPSTYSTVLHDYLSDGYPLGAFVPLGVGHELIGQDSAWLFQPQIATLAAMLGLCLYSLPERLVSSRALRALCAFLGAQAALLYGYAYWSGIKEVTASMLVALMVALLLPLLEGAVPRRAVVPLAVVAAALVDVEAIVGIVWFTALGLLALAGLALDRIRPRLTVPLVLFAALAAVLGIPAIATASSFIAGSGQITSSGAVGLGNLLHPLSSLQLFGIWPVGDFRLRPSPIIPTVILILLAAAGICAAVGLALRRRTWGTPLYLATAAAGAGVVAALGALGHGSPWLDGKAFAIASPAFVTTAVAGGSLLLTRRWRFAGLPLLAAVAAGVLWSNGLAYSNVWLAPRAQLEELETIGQRFAGEGPTLMTEYQPYGVRHFLRSMDPEAASERRFRPDFLRTGAMLVKGASADLDQFELGSVLAYRTLVLRTSPLESRPPSVYRLVWSGRYYEVWQRALDPAGILEHLPLGNEIEPDGVPACGAVQRLGALAAQHGGTVVASERPAAIGVPLAGAVVRPAAWQVTPDGELIPHGDGIAFLKIDVPRRGRYGVWLGGSFRDQVDISIDGREVGTKSGQLSEEGQLVPFGSIELSAGPRTVELRYTRARLSPGSGSYSFEFGPLELGQSASAARLLTLAPARASSLCGKSLDWIEAVVPN